MVQNFNLQDAITLIKEHAYAPSEPVKIGTYTQEHTLIPTENNSNYIELENDPDGYSAMQTIHPASAKDLLAKALENLHWLLEQSIKLDHIGDDAYYDYYPDYIEQIQDLANACGIKEQLDKILQDIIDYFNEDGAYDL